MYYKIVNSRGVPLSAFHSNGGWEIKDVFPCSSKNYIIFDNKDDANEYLTMIISKCEDQEIDGRNGLKKH
jgi:hypothetical protein